jgi:hypothetical protein
MHASSYTSSIHTSSIYTSSIYRYLDLFDTRGTPYYDALDGEGKKQQRRQQQQQQQLASSLSQVSLRCFRLRAQTSAASAVSHDPPHCLPQPQTAFATSSTTHGLPPPPHPLLTPAQCPAPEATAC